MLIVDESHILANPTKKSRTLLAVLKEYKGDYILSLTATPYRNTLVDYHFQLALIGHPLGLLSRAQFEALFNISEYTEPDVKLLSQLTGSVFITKTKEEAGIIIDYEIEQIAIPQTPAFAKRLNQILEEARTMYISVGGRTRAINTAMQNLRIACAEEKLSWLKEQIKLSQEKTVVMSNFNKAVLDKLGEYLDLSVYKASMKEKFEHVKAFERGDFNTFLAQRAIGATSLNVQTASKLILADLHYSLDFFVQAIGRVVRRGQKNKVKILIPLIEDSIEVKILNIIRRKHDQYVAITSSGQDDLKGQIAFGELNGETGKEIWEVVEEVVNQYIL